MDALEHRMLTALAEAAVADARRDPDADEVPHLTPSLRFANCAERAREMPKMVALTDSQPLVWTLPFCDLGNSGLKLSAPA